MLEKLMEHKGTVNACRIGHPARVLPSIMKYTLDALVANSDYAKEVSTLKKELNRLVEKISKAKDKNEV